MPARFFLDRPPSGDTVRIDGELAHHLARSLRVRPGDAIVAVHGGVEHGVTLTSVAETVDGTVTWSRPVTGEPRLRVTLVQALPRERMEDCIDIAVQAGVSAIVPVHTERTVSRPADDRAAARVRRWNAVAREAAQLAGRGMIPAVHAPRPLSDALAALPPGTEVLACASAVDVAAGASPPVPLGEVALRGTDVAAGASPPMPPGEIGLRGTDVALVIGPEGGLGERDLAALVARRAVTVHLGPRVLRTRYAGAVATALLLARAGDLDVALAEAPA